MLCPLCASENDDRALVCRSCTRDIAVPPALLAERDMLKGKREALVRELEQVHARLHHSRRRS
jgi:hypothetical protein